VIARQPDRLFVLLGSPVTHSLSPTLHNAAFQAAGLSAVYVALRTRSELVAPLIAEICRRGGGGNVTLPHKARAARALDRPTEAVRATGACNTFWQRGGEVWGDNTDVAGFITAAEHVLGGGLAGRRVLVIGAGGAAAAVVHGCLSQEVAWLGLCNRTQARAEALFARMGAPDVIEVVRDARDLEEREYDLMVNATSLGLRVEDPLPVDPRRTRATALLDLVYGREETALVRTARASGWRAEDGRRMLVEQAVASFERWFDREAPRLEMLRAVGLG